jgi:hypothetical protein
MRKLNQWKNKILTDSEKRYVTEVLEPTLTALADAKKALKAQMPAAAAGNDVEIKLYEAELAEMDKFKARVESHMKGVSQRFSNRP